jgi:putative ABC transport system substrate-binding protein
MPVVGFLSFRSSGESSYLMDGFYRGLKEAGYVEGKNLAIEYRWAEGDYERLRAMAEDLVNRHVAVIAAAGGDVSALAAS